MILGSIKQAAKHCAFLVVVFFSQSINAQWSFVGPLGISQPNVYGLSIAIDTSGVPYVAHNDSVGVWVKRFDGSAWVPVGAKINQSAAPEAMALKIGADNVPVLAYSSTTPHICVFRFTNNTWSLLDSANLPPKGFFSNPHSLAVDSNGNVYVFYYKTGAQGTVWKYNGVTWQNLTNDSIVARPGSIAIGPDNAPYIFGWENYSGIVKRYDGVSWDTVGKAFSLTELNTPDMAFNSKGDLYVAYSAQIGSDQARVRRWTGTNWVNVGSQAITNGHADKYMSLVISSDDTLYVAYQDGTFTSQSPGVAMKFDGQSWNAVGVFGFTPYDANKIQLVRDKENNLYAAFRDYYSSSRLTVMKYTQPWNVTTAITESSNSSSQYWYQEGGFLHLTGEVFTEETEYDLYAISGQKIAGGTLANGNNTIPIDILPTGVYVARVKTGLKNVTIKVCVVN